MMWSNYHSHSSFCDGRETMEEFVKYAIAKGIRKYGFSSHAPVPFHTNWTMNADDYHDYEAEFHRLKIKYADKIELFLGLEIDFIVDCSNARSGFFADKKLDYAIGSIHYLDKLAAGKYWTIDGPFNEFNSGLTELFGGDIRQATERFYQITHQMMDIGGFDMLGHCDKITMHGSKYNDFDQKSAWYQNLIGQMLEKVKARQLILEINTKSLLERGITFPDRQFYNLIRDLDIPVTVNSDCHYPSKVIDGFQMTYRELKAVGFKYLYQIENAEFQPFEFDENGIKY